MRNWSCIQSLIPQQRLPYSPAVIGQTINRSLSNQIFVSTYLWMLLFILLKFRKFETLDIRDIKDIGDIRDECISGRTVTTLNSSPQSGGMRGAFPAYEIVLDELRDYRFYKPDMLHPSEQAVDYIWERFREWTFTPEMHTLYQQRIKEHKTNNHHANH